MSKTKTIMTNSLRMSIVAAALATAFPALAQQAPDAGQTLQQLTPPPETPRTSPAVTIEPPATTPADAGGAQVVLQSVSVGGNSVFSEAELLSALGDVTGKAYDLAGLRELAGRISEHYRTAGFPFALAYIPPQPMTDGKLRIEVVEGRYGKVQTLGDERLAASAQPFLAPLRPGDVISSAALERATLVLDDQPGIKLTPIIRPGQEIGTGDLDVRVERTPAITGEVGIDNHGNRYTGKDRLRGNLKWDGPFMLGDQVLVHGLYSEEGLWMGSLGYSLPLGTSGLRGNVRYAHTYYELGKDFAALDATGTAKVSSIGVSYPIIRSQRANLSVAASYQHKDLNDRQALAGTSNGKSSDTIPITLQFDRRDGLAGGGITYGSLTYTPGRLELDSTLTAADTASKRNTRGDFQKVNIDAARIQALPANLALYGRLSAQWAQKNLDSSEVFSLGGANGVRAFPSGEGNGDEGWLAQVELRYSWGVYSPFVFYDAGRIRVNADPDQITPAVTDNRRALAGSGLGLRYKRNDWTLDASVAWRNEGGAPQSDTADRNPRMWVSAGYKF
jgi:hemolysin activation/secretion protein